MGRTKGTTKGVKAKAKSTPKVSKDTIKEIIANEMLVFTREEAGWMYDVFSDYLTMIEHTKHQSEEIRKSYEKFLAPDEKLPEGVAAEQVASDLEQLKRDNGYLDVAKMRVEILKEATNNFIMTHTNGQDAADDSNDKPVHEVSEEVESVPSEQSDETDNVTDNADGYTDTKPEQSATVPTA